MIIEDVESWFKNLKNTFISLAIANCEVSARVHWAIKQIQIQEKMLRKKSVELLKKQKR